MNNLDEYRGPGLESRLNCFGEYDSTDQICKNSCALCLNCAIAKNRFLSYQLLDDASFTISPYDSFEVE